MSINNHLTVIIQNPPFQTLHSCSLLPPMLIIFHIVCKIVHLSVVENIAKNGENAENVHDENEYNKNE